MTQILVVDDETNMRKVLRALLERDGYEVQLAENGLEALEILQNHHVDIVVTDLRMPGLDGMSLLRRVIEEYQGVPVIMITAHGTVDTAIEAVLQWRYEPALQNGKPVEVYFTVVVDFSLH